MPNLSLMKANQSQDGGCLTQLAVALLVVVVAGALLIGSLAFFLNHSIKKYTTEVPPPSPAFTAEEAQAQYRSLAPRIEKLLSDRSRAIGDSEPGTATGGSSSAFEGTSETSEPSVSTIAAHSDERPSPSPFPTIRLSAADLNALAYRQIKDLSGDAYANFTISTDRLILNTSFPLDGVPLLNGRFFVGTIELTEPPAGYSLPLYLQTITAAGKPLPDALIRHFRDPAEARKVLRANGLGDELGAVRSIRIESGELVVELYTPATGAE